MIKAELISNMGSDLTVVNAARVSFHKESKWKLNDKNQLELSSADTKLIKYLAKHNHFTPFTHPQITLRETVPIFVARQRFKHVVGFTYNEVSRRYVDEPPEFFHPEIWRQRPDKSIKQGSGNAHPDTAGWSALYKRAMESARDLYTLMIRDGIAPEQARMVLPQSMLTSYYVTGSLAAFARMYSLRYESHAQKEIQDLALAAAELIAPLYPVSWAALTVKDA